MNYSFHSFINLCQRAAQSLFLTLLAVLCVQGIVLPAGATGVYDMPPFAADTWVLDQAEVLSRISESKLTSDLAALAQKTGNQVRFVTIHRLDYGETPETFAKQLFEAWFPEAEDRANQALVVLDNVTNGAAIVSGDKVKANLPEDIATSITQETLMVPIRKGNYNQGFLDGSARLVTVLSGEADPGPPVVADTVKTEGTFRKAEETNATSAAIVVGGLLILATAIPMATYYFYQYMQSR
ncbi:MAG: TPM domain-containing protein [Leptolyngbyaceae cyanobacterium bins.59]|nr:TPM domain-containing protein [Leptolyngbyaceae cyanobacterium bins.59]